MKQAPSSVDPKVQEDAYRIKATESAANDNAGRWARFTLGARAMRMTGRGRHLPTGFKTWDEATRGGPMEGSLNTIGAIPCGGKTTLLMHLVMHYARNNAHVGVFAADEKAEGLLTRLGQQEKFSREDIDQASPETVAAMKERFDAMERQIIMVDINDDDAPTLREMAEELHRRANGEPVVIFVDSLQSYARAVYRDIDSPKVQADHAASELRSLAKDTTVYASSEMNRQWYRGGKSGKRCNPMAAYKESGGIEYSSDATYALAPDGDRIRFYIVKNRMGRQDIDFWIKINSETAEVEECDPPDGFVDDSDSGGAAGKTAEEKAAEELLEDCERVLAAISSVPGMTTQKAIATAAKMQNARAGKAVAELAKTGLIAKNGEGGWTAVSAGSA